MMHNDIEHFDLEIRSMLENAEEAVPAGMWEGISSQLQARKAAAARRRRLAVVYSAVAAAAAIAVAVILLRAPSGTRISAPVADNSTTVSGHDAEVIQVVETPPQPTMIAEAEIPVKRPPIEKAVSPEKTVHPIVNEAVTESEETASSILEDESEITAKAPAADTDNSTDYHTDTYNKESADAFAQMLLENEQKHRRKAIVLTVGGTAQTNGNPTAFSKRAGMLMVGDFSKPSQTTVTPTGKESSYAIPVSVGISARVPVSKKLSIGTGLTYSYLERTFPGTYTEVRDGEIVNRLIASDITNSLHYVGIPLRLYYDAIRQQRINFYAHAGMEIEKGIQSKFSIPNSSSTIHFKESVKGVQLSAGAGIGVSFRLANNVGLYLDPSVRYYFKCSQPVSIRTQQPLMIDLEAGLRFDIGR